MFSERRTRGVPWPEQAGGQRDARCPRDAGMLVAERLLRGRFKAIKFSSRCRIPPHPVSPVGRCRQDRGAGNGQWCVPGVSDTARFSFLYPNPAKLAPESRVWTGVRARWLRCSLVALWLLRRFPGAGSVSGLQESPHETGYVLDINNILGLYLD